jgi:hypothetical protein
MATTQRPDSSLNSSSAAINSVLDEVINDIKATKEELQAVKRKIGGIEGGDDDLAKEHGYSTRSAALESLRAKEAALQNKEVALQNKEVELLKRGNLLLQQQQQSGAGTSMLPVRLALVIFLFQRSCCMLANPVAFRVCLVACAFDPHSCGLLLLDTSTALRA